MIRAASVLRTVPRALAKPSFHTSSLARAASVFNMPAMSPTMTEGGIVGWKYKAGDSFGAGDVLLEVETDKATIDVEAQDDGILWEILVTDGANGIPVGKPIAFLAEPGDDLATLEKPKIEEDTKAAPKEQAEEKQPEPKESKPQPKAAAPSPSSSSSSSIKADPNQKVSPSVELLLHQHHISLEDAFAKVPASGPKGRLLKGDILAYVGEIKQEAVDSIASFIKSHEKLDLSNIQLAVAQPKEDAKPQQHQKQDKPKPQNILTIQFSSELGPEVTKDTFRHAFEQAVQAATRDAYAIQYPQYSTGPSATGLNSGDLFDDLLAPAATESRFEVYDVSYKFSTATSARAAASSFDSLLGLEPAAPSVDVSEGDGKVDVEFKLKYNTKVADSKRFVEEFQDSLLDYVPSNKLTILS